MEHILQFGVNIDEQKIVDVATGRAAAEIISKVQHEINDYTRGYESRLKCMFTEEIKNTINENKEKIIDEAIKQTVRNISRTKMFKEKFGELE